MSRPRSELRERRRPCSDMPERSRRAAISSSTYRRRSVVRLSGKVIAVSGGFGVLGQAVAAILTGYGSTVASIDFAAAPTTGQAADVHVYGGIDLADEESANSVMQRIVHVAGRLDGLINIAGGIRWEKLEGGALETWARWYSVDLRT